MVRKTAFKTGLLIENRYRILSVVSLDRMGALYRASDEAREGEVVALKTVMLDVPAGEEPGHVEQFQREFKILTQLHHPNLVDVYDYGITAEGELYFTMEWIEGYDLDAGLMKVDQASAHSWFHFCSAPP
jgi:serine/threonine protein kinase